METERVPSKKRSATTGLGLLAVQSVSCAVVVLAVLILRLVDGGVFQQLRVYFQEAMQQNALTAAIHALWDENAVYTTATTDATTTTTTATTATPETGSTTLSDQVATAAWTGVDPTTAPVSGAVVTSGFGSRNDPFSGERAFHNGVDLAAPVGTAIAAMWDGEVIAVDAEGTGSLGKHIRLQHGGGVEVLYAHCDTIAVAVGDVVAAGKTVATVGDTGRSTGAHLHLSVWQNGSLYDPAPLLSEVAYV